jgi:Protein of unknown function (DUF2637)
MNTPAAPAVRVTTVAAVVVVALVAAVVSYAHMEEVAHAAGEAWRSYLVPLSIDGLVVAASMVLLTRHRAELPGGPLAWSALAAGVVASLAANMADAQPTVTARLLAGWPAVAFAVAFELLLQQRRAERHDRSAPEPTRPPVAAVDPVSQLHRPLPSPSPVPESVEPAPAAQPVPRVAPVVSSPTPVPPGGTPEPSPMATRQSTDDDLVARVRKLLAESDGHPVGRRTVAKRLGITEHQARTALDLMAATAGPVLNGTGGESKPFTSSRSAQ